MTSSGNFSEIIKRFRSNTHTGCCPIPPNAINLNKSSGTVRPSGKTNQTDYQDFFFSTQVNKFLVIKVPGNVGRKGAWCGLWESDYVYQRVDGYLHLPVCVEATVYAASQGRNSVWLPPKGRWTGPEPQEEGLCTAKKKKKDPQAIVHVPARVGGGPAGRGREPPLPGFMVGVLARGIIASWSICGDEQRCRVEERHRRAFDSTRARALAFVRPFAIRAISVGW